MRTAKNRIIKSIKILANGPLYCVLLVLAGWNCFGGERGIGRIRSTQNVNRLIPTDSATDENIEGIINQDSDVLEQPSTMPQAPFGSSNNTNQKLGTAESHGPISTDSLRQPNQNMILGGTKENRRDGDKVTGPNSQVNNDRLDNVEKER